MRRFWVATALLLLVLGAVGGIGMASDPTAAGVQVQVDAQLRQAAKAPVSPLGNLGQRRASWVTIATDPDGAKVAVIDQTVPGAPQGEPVISGTVMRELGITRVKLIKSRVQHPKKTSQRDGATPALPAPDKLTAGKPNDSSAAPGGTATPDGKVGAMATRSYHDPWLYEGNADSWYTDEIARGRRPIGCVNRTRETKNVNCTLTTKASFTVTANSKLTFDQVFELGFEIGHTDEEELSFTVNEIPPYTMYVLTPKLLVDRQAWDEIQHHWTCTRPVLGWWCIDEPQWLHSHSARGRAARADVFYAELTERPAR